MGNSGISKVLAYGQPSSFSITTSILSFVLSLETSGAVFGNFSSGSYQKNEREGWMKRSTTDVCRSEEEVVLKLKVAGRTMEKKPRRVHYRVEGHLKFLTRLLGQWQKTSGTSGS